MKFIELHNGSFTRWINPESIEMIEPTTIKDRPEISSYALLKSNYGLYFNETPEEIFKKIAEATQSEREEILQKFAEAEQRDIVDDAVTVIRCKDCKYAKKTSQLWLGTDVYCVSCERLCDEFESYSIPMNENDFCSRGQRRENNG